MVSPLNKCYFLSVHPCEKPTIGGCAQICNKDEEKAKCSCKEPNFKLAKDGKACDPGKV